METNGSTEENEIKERIEEQNWFKILPKHTQKSLLKQSREYLALLLKQEIEIVTTKDEANFTFGYNVEGKPIIHIPEFSATEIGVAKLNRLNLSSAEKMRFIIENISLMERPLSNKKKNLISKLLSDIGDKKLWDLGVAVEEKTRNIQLRIDSGLVEINYLPSLESAQAERSKIILRNYLWLWQEILSNCKRAEFHISVSSLCRTEDAIIRKENEKPPFLFQIHHSPYGRNTVVSAIGPFSALKIAISFPIDDPDRFEFWERKWDHWPDAENFTDFGHLQVMQRRDQAEKPEIFEYTCPKCNGEGTDSETSTEYRREINEKGDFVCWRCSGVGMINKNDDGNPVKRFFDALKYMEKREGISNYKSLLNDLLPHLDEENARNIWIWSSVYYPFSRVDSPKPLIRKIALPVTGSYLEITQQIVREDPIWAQGDLMGVTDDVEVSPIEIRIRKMSEIKEGRIEFQEEAENFFNE